MNFTEDDLKTFQQYNDEGYGNSSHTDCASVNDYWNKWLYEIAGVLPSSLGGLTELDANQITECLNYINNELDTLNSVSQELLIELQSETSRRDQAYDLTTAVNKSFNGVMMTVAGNL